MQQKHQLINRGHFNIWYSGKTEYHILNLKHSGKSRYSGRHQDDVRKQLLPIVSGLSY